MDIWGWEIGGFKYLLALYAERVYLKIILYMQRISLTKQQLQNKAGLELLELCQTITAEGKLTDQEILSLKKWLDENAEADLRSYTYLKTIVSNILFDGKITEAEKNELYKSLEKILPPEHRTIATIRRKEVEARKGRN